MCLHGKYTDKICISKKFYRNILKKLFWSMTEVIAKALAYTKLNAKQLAERIGLDRPQAIYDILKGKTKSISPAMANKILSVFPEEK